MQRSRYKDLYAFIPVVVTWICFSFVYAESGEQTRFEWPMVAGNAAWTGFSPDTRVKPPFRLKWVTKIKSCMKATLSVAGGKAVAVLKDGGVVCFDAEDGSILWENRAAHGTSSATCDGKRVFVKGVTALDAETGKMLWRKGSRIVASWRLGVAFKDGIVYWGIRTEEKKNAVCALKAENGETVWEKDVGGQKTYISAPSLVNDLVLVTTTNPNAALALSQKTGDIVWRTEGLHAKRAISSDGRHAWVADTVKGVTALDVKTGKILWTWGGTSSELFLTKNRKKLHRKPFYCSHGVSSNQPTVAYNRLFVKSYGGVFSVIDPKTGKLDWFFNDGAGTGCAMPSAAGGYLYFCTGNYAPRTDGGRYIHAIDPKTHTSVWKYRTGGRICSMPAIAYGRLYVPGNDGRVYCFEPCSSEYAPPEPQPAPKTPAVHPAPTAAPFKGEPGTPEAGGKPDGGKDWPMYGGCPARCGLEMKIGLPIKEAWKFQTGGKVKSSPVISGGFVYAGSDSGKLFALDLKTGKKVWEADMGGKVRCAPAVSSGLVVCGSSDHRMRAFDAAAGGKPKWTFRTGGPIFSSPAVAEGRVVFGSCDHRCYCLRLSDGAEFWRYKARHEIHAAPAVANGTVYIGTWMWKLHALDLGTGKLLPSFKPDRTYRMTDCGRIEGVAVYRGLVSTTNAKDESFGGAYTLDANTGRVLYKIKNAYSFGAPAFSKKWAFFPSSWRGVAVLDLEANKRHSNKAQYGSSVLETPLAAVNLMILATKDGSIEARSIYSGDKDHPAKQVWQWKPPGKTKFDTAPAAADGFIVVGCDDGYIYGFSYNKE